MSTTTDTATPGADMGEPSGGGSAPKDPYIRGTDETVLLDLRELRAQEAADKAAREAAAGRGAELATTGTAGAAGTIEVAGTAGATGAELERYHGSHRRDAVLYADGGTAIPLDRVREVCHDLRQPVAAILMLASAAELRPDVPERVRDVLGEIMSQTEEISATVRQFLDDAKQGVDGLGAPVPCNVAGLAAESVERWRATFDGALDLAAAEDPLHVTVDPVLFKRALGNVLSNGTRAAGDTGRVQVTVRRFETAEGERAVIEVDDSGPGFGNIPSGHGLGLAVVRRTIEAAGGSVELAEGPLGGALVRLVLPVTPIRPLSADDELTKTFHGEISLSQLAAELAAGGPGRHPALAEFEGGLFDDDLFDEDDDDFEDGFEGGFEGGFEDEDEADDEEEFAEEFAEVVETPAPAAPSLTGGHAFLTKLSAWPEPMAIPSTQEQLAIGGPAGPGNPFAARATEQQEAVAVAPATPPPATLPPATPSPAIAPPADNRTYFGLPLKDDPAPQNRLYGGSADIAAHPVPASVFAAHQNAAHTPQAPGEIAAAAHQGRSAAQGPAAQLPAAPAQPPAAAPAFPALSPAANLPASPLAGPAQPAARPSVALPGAAPAAQAPAAVPAAFAAPVTPSAQAAEPPAAAPAFAGPVAPSAQPAATVPPTGHPSAAEPPAAPATQAPAAAPTAFAAPEAAQPTEATPATTPTEPTFDPGDTQPLHIIPTGQDDTALASIQLPSQATLTHPPRIPASALQPVASVQLSLLPGGAF
ncbi:signal transduction histidine kinase [Catenulispora sp. MAP12-49]|uniref:sensor histidine kinase n=1 Tax=Catenulispora sp. MAP12-49 TaxID=3156302 RepID=UPI003518557D